MGFLPNYHWLLYTLYFVGGAVVLYCVVKLVQYPIYARWFFDIRIFGTKGLKASDIKGLLEANKKREQNHEWFMRLPSLHLREGERLVISTTFCAIALSQIGAPNRADIVENLTPSFMLTNQRLILFTGKNRSIWKGQRPTDLSNQDRSNGTQLTCEDTTFSSTLKNGEPYPNVTLTIRNWGTIAIYHPAAKQIYEFLASK